jgi:hypothetical protein
MRIAKALAGAVDVDGLRELEKQGIGSTLEWGGGGIGGEEMGERVGPFMLKA